MSARVAIAACLALLLLGACAPEPGSDAWCAGLERKPLLEWTADEVKGYFGICKAPITPPVPGTE